MINPIFFIAKWWEIKKMDRAANDFIYLVEENLKDSRGLHVETAIAATCSVAGTLIMRSANIDFSRDPSLQPGQYVIVVALEEKGTQALGFLSAACGSFGLEPNTGWTLPIPDENKPHFSDIDLVRRFERPLNLVCYNKNIDENSRFKVALLAAAKLIKSALTIGLNPEIGKAIAGMSLISSTKMVPPLPEPNPALQRTPPPGAADL